MKQPELEWEGEQKPEPAYRNEFYEWGEALVVSLAVIIVIFTFFFRPIGVDGSSMVPTLHDRDQLFISNLFYDEPEYGDIVVLTKDSFLAKPIVKRVIATGGQSVDIDFTTGEVTVDGVVLDEPYIADKTYLAEGLTFPCYVPEGHVFVMGDNRNESSDSRNPALGVVDNRYIAGRVLFRMLPISQIGTVE